MRAYFIVVLTISVPQRTKDPVIITHIFMIYKWKAYQTEFVITALTFYGKLHKTHILVSSFSNVINVMLHRICNAGRSTLWPKTLGGSVMSVLSINEVRFFFNEYYSFFYYRSEDYYHLSGIRNLWSSKVRLIFYVIHFLLQYFDEIMTKISNNVILKFYIFYSI